MPRFLLALKISLVPTKIFLFFEEHINEFAQYFAELTQQAGRQAGKRLTTKAYGSETRGVRKKCVLFSLCARIAKRVEYVRTWRRGNLKADLGCSICLAVSENQDLTEVQADEN